MSVPTRVLMINISPAKTMKIWGGVASFSYNIYKSINKQKIQYDFLSLNQTTFDLKREEIEKMGGKIFELGISNYKSVFHVGKVYKFIKTHHYDVVHINMTVPVCQCYIAIAARMAGVKKIIAHSHSFKKSNRLSAIKRKIMNPLLSILATDYIACSDDAAKQLFSKRLLKSGEIKIVNNGIKTEEFIFNEENKKRLRDEFNIKNEFVIGHIGRFSRQKNHSFLIDVFGEIIQNHPNSKLLLIGKGDLEQEMQNKIEKAGLNEKVIFAGERTDIPELLSAMDIFIFPSIHEGLGIVAIEAQAAGLIIIASNAIPKEACITDNFKYYSLDDTAKEWAVKVLEYKDGYEKKNMRDEIVKAGYDVSTAVYTLEKLYLS